MLGLTPTGSGQVELSTEPLGKGGEGSVFAVISHSIPGIPEASKLVAKIYHAPEEENRKAKLKAMVTAPVADHAVAWPQALVFDNQKLFQGYLMVKLDKANNREWLYLANSKDRNKIAPEFDTRYALAAVRNLAAAILAVHSVGHRIGDINESNIFVRADGTALIVDSDSMQINADSGEIFPCVVGKPEYTAPELSYGSFRNTPRTIPTDLFAFAVASFQLLSGGATPHQGSFDPNDPNDPLPTVERIRQGVLPSLAPQRAKTFGFTPRPGVPVEAFPDFLKEHLIGFLSPSPEMRDTEDHNLETLIANIDAYAPTLVRCDQQKLHWHEPHEACPWCASASASGVDPWASRIVRNAPSQVSLPAIGFNDDAAQAPINRAPAAIAGQQAHQANQQSTTGAHDPLQQLLAANPGLLQAAAATYASLNSPQTPQSTAAPRPKKVKGKVTVEYADGSWGVRPPLSVMLRQSPKLFIWAVKEETWSILKCWWPVERKLASPAALITGLLFSLIVIYGNWVTALSLFNAYIPSGSENLNLILAAIPTLTSLIAVIMLIVSALRDRIRTRKQHGGLSNFDEEKVPLTILRFIPLAIFYGIPAVAIGTVAGVFTFMRAVVRA